LLFAGDVVKLIRSQNWLAEKANIETKSVTVRGKRMKRRTLALCLLVCLLAGCGGGNENIYTGEKNIGSNSWDVEPGSLAEEPAIPDILEPVASGTAVEENEKAIIDYSNINDGYVMVKYIARTEKRLKAQVKGPTTTYSYNITQGEWEVFPFSDGNGDYQVVVYENVEGSQYSTQLAVSVAVELEDEFAPFLRPNQYVDYGVAPETVKKAAYLTAGKEETLDKVQAVYDYVVNALKYDKKRAETVKSGYLPVLDSVLAEKKGICFDYAALMTGMLRSQSIPCKLVVGYAGDAYHAWISVYSERDGWIDGAIYFDGTTWKRMDPTFASSANKSSAIMKYIGNGENYKEKYLY